MTLVLKNGLSGHQNPPSLRHVLCRYNLSESSTQESLGSVALDGTADLAAGDVGNTRLSSLVFRGLHVREKEENDRSLRLFRSLGVDPFELGPALQRRPLGHRMYPGRRARTET